MARRLLGGVGLLLLLAPLSTPSMAEQAVATPTAEELSLACPAEYSQCTASPACATALDASNGRVPRSPPPHFQQLIACFQQSAVGSVRRAAQKAHHDALRKVVVDVKCDACQYVVEDLWAMVLHRPPLESGEKAKSLEATISIMIRNMCGDPENHEDPGEVNDTKLSQIELY